MKIVETGILARGKENTARAVLTFPSVTVLSDKTLLATCRAGSTKDSSDETVELYRSRDRGANWDSPRQCFERSIQGTRGSLKCCYLTEVRAGHLMAACMWVNRQALPGKPLFNPETEGCLPMAILLADSHDFGDTWTAWRMVDVPPEIGPPSLTNPILKLSNGDLAISIESNKQYEDRLKWHQQVVLFHSSDEGKTWGKPVTAGKDPTGRIFNWDQRAAVAPGGEIATFLWTYDSETHKYLEVHRRISADNGRTWSKAEKVGFSDQPGHPAMFPDGKIVLPWVDRYGTQSIRVRLAHSIKEDFDPMSEVVLYEHCSEPSSDAGSDTTGAELAQMEVWSYGLPYAEYLPEGSVLVVYYAGTHRSMDIHWARVSV